MLGRKVSQGFAELSLVDQRQLWPSSQLPSPSPWCLEDFLQTPIQHYIARTTRVAAQFEDKVITP